jgi:proline racemase
MLRSAIPATDYHTGGEPFRIVTDPPVPIQGRTVAERRARAIEDPAVQGLRAAVHRTARPYGSGTCARLAVLAADGRLPAGTVLRHESIVGSTFTGTVLDTADAGGRPAVIPQVTGTAYRTGEHMFWIDPCDPLVPGFVLR